MTYADTILVNAKTGKQAKCVSQGGQRRNQTMKLKGGGKSTFQKYQDNLFNMTSNRQIATVLNNAKKFQIGAMKEDLGIKQYI